MDDLKQGFRSPLILYREFCIYRHFLEEHVHGGDQKLMGPQMMQMNAAVR